MYPVLAYLGMHLLWRTKDKLTRAFKTDTVVTIFDRALGLDDTHALTAKCGWMRHYAPHTPRLSVGRGGSIGL